MLATTAQKAQRKGAKSGASKLSGCCFVAPELFMGSLSLVEELAGF